MARSGFIKMILPTGVGFALNMMAHVAGAQGDVAAVLGNRGAALSNHLAGFLFEVAAVACFGYTARHIWLSWKARGGPSEPLEAVPRPLKIPLLDRDDEPFDPDAALARYLARKQEATVSDPPGLSDFADPPPPPVTTRPTFGRKQR